MSIPSSITTAWQSLADQVTAAQPALSASRATRTALKLNAANLVDSIQSALTTTSILDTWAAPVDPQSIISGINTVVTAAQDQATLSLMRGIAGRAASNLDQLP